MKKLIVLAGAFVLLLLDANVSYPKEKTGEVKDNTYTDSKFGFELTALQNWKIKREEEPSLVRVLMTQKNYKMSTIPGATKYNTAIPIILVLADTTSLSLEQVDTCLIKTGKGLGNQDDFNIKLDLISNSEMVEIHEIAIDSVTAREYILKKPYKKTGEDLRVRDPIYGSQVIIEDYLAGRVILFKKGRNLYVVQFSCEREFFYPTDSEFQKIISSWNFTD